MKRRGVRRVDGTGGRGRGDIGEWVGALGVSGRCGTAQLCVQGRRRRARPAWSGPGSGPVTLYPPTPPPPPPPPVHLLPRPDTLAAPRPRHSPSPGASPRAYLSDDDASSGSSSTLDSLRGERAVGGGGVGGSRLRPAAGGAATPAPSQPCLPERGTAVKRQHLCAPPGAAACVGPRARTARTWTGGGARARGSPRPRRRARSRSAHRPQVAQREPFHAIGTAVALWARGAVGQHLLDHLTLRAARGGQQRVDRSPAGRRALPQRVNQAAQLQLEQASLLGLERPVRCCVDLLVRLGGVVAEDLPQRSQFGVHVLTRLDQRRADHAAHLMQLNGIERRRDLLPEEGLLLGELGKIARARGLGGGVGARCRGHPRLVHPPRGSVTTVTEPRANLQLQAFSCREARVTWTRNRAKPSYT